MEMRGKDRATAQFGLYAKGPGKPSEGFHHSCFKNIILTPIWTMQCKATRAKVGISGEATEMGQVSWVSCDPAYNEGRATRWVWSRKWGQTLLRPGAERTKLHTRMYSQEPTTAQAGYFLSQHLPNLEALRKASGCSEHGWSKLRKDFTDKGTSLTVKEFVCTICTISQCSSTLGSSTCN